MKFTVSQWFGVLGAFLSTIMPAMTSLGVPLPLALAFAAFGSYLSFMARAESGEERVLAAVAESDPALASKLRARFAADQRGAVGLGVLTGLAVGALIACAMLSGCSSAPVVLEDDKPISLAVDSGPPCHIIGQHSDGETAISYTAPGTCDPHVSLLWLCRRVRALLGTGEPEPLACRSVQR